MQRSMLAARRSALQPACGPKHAGARHVSRPAGVRVSRCGGRPAAAAQQQRRYTIVRKSRSLAVRAVAFAGGLEPDAYCCVGLAHCFEKSDEGKLVERMVIEPISASSLECMANGARTSFKCVTALRFEEAYSRDRHTLPAEFQEAMFCDKWGARVEAEAGTWQRSYAQDNLMDIVPLGKVRGAFNFSLDDKRVLNMENVVTDSDNIKQDMSIDVYGRKEDEQPAAAAAAPAAAAEEEEDDLDALLAA